jgi:hypothetical protein
LPEYQWPDRDAEIQGWDLGAGGKNRAQDADVPMRMGDAGILEMGLEGVGRGGAVKEGHIHQRHASGAADDDGGQQGSLQTG